MKIRAEKALAREYKNFSRWEIKGREGRKKVGKGKIRYSGSRKIRPTAAPRLFTPRSLSLSLSRGTSSLLLAEKEKVRLPPRFVYTFGTSETSTVFSFLYTRGSARVLFSRSLAREGRRRRIRSCPFSPCGATLCARARVNGANQHPRRI